MWVITQLEREANDHTNIIIMRIYMYTYAWAIVRFVSNLCTHIRTYTMVAYAHPITDTHIHAHSEIVR